MAREDNPEFLKIEYNEAADHKPDDEEVERGKPRGDQAEESGQPLRPPWSRCGAKGSVLLEVHPDDKPNEKKYKDSQWEPADDTVGHTLTPKIG